MALADQNGRVFRGRFITFEGGDGCGKTTQADLLMAFLQGQNIDCLRTREPGGTELGDLVRTLVLVGLDKPLSDYTELLLFFAARVEHINQIILPALQRNCWVICERFVDSSYAYQGGGRGISVEDIDRLTAMLPSVSPDLTIFLDAPPNVALRRKASNSDRFEQQAFAFHERVRAVYQARAQASSSMVTLSAESNIKPIHDEIKALLQRWVDDSSH